MPASSTTDVKRTGAMRNEYLIDRYRVVFDAAIGWRCVCAEFIESGECKHSRESAGRLDAQRRIIGRAKPAYGMLVAFSNRVESDAG